MRLFTACSALVMLATPADSAQFDETARCEPEDSLSSRAQARGRAEWFKACYPDEIFKHYKSAYPNGGVTVEEALERFDHQMFVDPFSDTPLAYPLYVSFLRRSADGVWSRKTGKTDGAGKPVIWVAPRVANAACNKPAGFEFRMTCRIGCAAPEMRVLLGRGYTAIGSMGDETGTVHLVTLAEDATLDNPVVAKQPLELYLRSDMDNWQELVVLELESGTRLRLTPNHPVVDGNGKMRRVDDLYVGEQLVTLQGTLDPIASLSQDYYWGKVYNVAPASRSLPGNIVILEGYLTGSQYVQEERVRGLNRLLLRNTIPEQLVTE